MLGIAGNRFSNMIKVTTGEIVTLVKEAQMENKPSRIFFLDGQKRINLAFDGMFLVDTTTGELVDEQRFDAVHVATQRLS